MDKTQQAKDLFNKLANLYQDKFMDVSLYDDTIEVFCRNITAVNANILEVACGPGNITKALLTKRPDFKILCTDIAPNMLELAAANNPGAEFRLMDARNICETEKNFHAVVCAFGLPYLSKEDAILFIADAGKVLLPGGALYLSTMEDDYSKSGIETSSTGDQLYMHYHEADYLISALEENGFNIIETARKQYPGKGESIVTDLILIARK